MAQQVGLGSICCEEKDELKWAREREYDKFAKESAS